MSKFRFIALVVGLGLALWGTSVFADEHNHKAPEQHGQASVERNVHFVGEVIDIACYIRMDARGPGHIKCAEMCAKQGSPLGILDESTKQIYLVFPEGHGDPKEKVMPFIGKRVQVAGKAHAKGGLNAITVEKISEAKE